MFKDQTDRLSVFNAHRVEYLVVGGHAVGEHSQPRGTKDLDILIRSDEKNSQAVFRALAEYGAPLAGLPPDDFNGKPDSVFQIGVEPARIDILQSIQQALADGTITSPPPTSPTSSSLRCKPQTFAVHGAGYNPFEAHGMQLPIIRDLIDWHGCEAVEFDPLKLGGRATVGNTRMDADGVLINFEGGLSVDDIVESFGVEHEAVEKIIAFASGRRLGGWPKSLSGVPHLRHGCIAPEVGGKATKTDEVP